MTIQLDDISLKLGEKQVFHHFNLKAGAGDKLLIRGPSGSGKSTLLRLILGFVLPDEGTVRLDGQALSRENVWAMRRRMAFVSQGLDIGAGKVSAFIKEIFSYRANQHLSYDEDQVLDHFRHFRLEPEKLGQDISALSGGEKQRLALITALVLDREVYLLDEVTSSIDESLRKTVIGYLSGMEEKTLLVVSHDQGWEGFKTIEL